MMREPMPYAALVDGHDGYTVPAHRRRAVVLAARAAGVSVNEWVDAAIDAKLAAIGLARAVFGPDNGDEYGQRVVQHQAMVRGMER